MRQQTRGSLDRPPRRRGRRGGSFTLCSLLLCALMLAIASQAHAEKLCCETFGSPGILGEQFALPAFGDVAGGVAVNVGGNGPGASAGDIYVVDRGNNRVQQFNAKPNDLAGHRFVRAFGIDVGGAGVNVCTDCGFLPGRDGVRRRREG